MSSATSATRTRPSASTPTTCDVHVGIRPQAPEIGDAVSRAAAADPFDAVGAGDQGLMFGYATDETATLMPLPLDLAHRLARRLAQVRRDGTLPYLRPDGKTQVTVGYDADGAPAAIVAVVVSAQHDPGIGLDRIRADLRREVVGPVIPAGLLRPETAFHLNPSGSFEMGGPTGDTGLTGRKIIVDTYGGAGHHGGGCFSGKDPTKVDRSGAYAARQAAKWLVAKGSPAGPRSPSPTRSGSRRRSRSTSSRSGPPRPAAVTPSCPRWSHRPSTSARRRSSRASVCGGRSTARSPPTATSVATTSTCRGSGCHEGCAL